MATRKTTPVKRGQIRSFAFFPKSCIGRIEGKKGECFIVSVLRDPLGVSKPGDVVYWHERALVLRRSAHGG